MNTYPIRDEQIKLILIDAFISILDREENSLVLGTILVSVLEEYQILYAEEEWVGKESPSEFYH